MHHEDPSQGVRSAEILVGECPIEVSFDVGLFFSGAPAGADIHSHCGYEVHACVLGTQTLMIDGDRVTLSPGEGIIVPPGLMHHCTNQTGGRISFCYHFSDRPCSLLTPLAFPSGIRRFPLGDLSALSARIREEYLNRKTGYLEIVQHLLSCLLLSLARAVSGDGQSERETAPQISRLTCIDRFFTLGCNRSPRKADLAKLLNVSERQVERVVREFYGMSFREKVMQMRFGTANYLLEVFHYPVSAVAEIVGYENVSSFYSAYKKHFGVSPSEHLKKDVKGTV